MSTLKVMKCPEHFLVEDNTIWVHSSQNHTGTMIIQGRTFQIKEHPSIWTGFIALSAKQCRELQMLLDTELVIPTFM